MPRPGEDDRDAVDRAFADLVAKFHLTAERPDPKHGGQPATDATTSTVSTSNEAVSTSNEAVSTSNEAVSTTNEAVSTTNEAVPTSNEVVSTSNEAVPGLEHPSVSEQPPSEPAWTDSEPLFRFSEPVSAAERTEPEERFVPEPPLPLRRPAWPVLVAWLAMGYAVLAVLATALGVRLPVWAGWLALAGFVGGFGLLVARLPRHRPPDAGDGAVL